MTNEQITQTNCIICGDCRDQLARIPDGSVDLIYLDPPFFSGKNYEIIWKDGAEIRSFTEIRGFPVDNDETTERLKEMIKSINNKHYQEQ